MKATPPITHVERLLLRRRRLLGLPAVAAIVLLIALGLATVIAGIVAVRRLAINDTPIHADIVAHFAHGSIGSEENSGLPYWIWQALPRLFPERFDGRLDYKAFGFLYDRQGELPIGIARRAYRGVDLVWFNCAICHTGTWRATEGDVPSIVHGMPSNNLDLYRFVRFLLDAAADERLAPERVLRAMRDAGARLGIVDRLLWQYYVIPSVREGLVQRRSRLLGLLAEQPAWGPGRVDTFNPYKLQQMGMMLGALAPEERIGAADFPSIFHQKPRDGMQLHWDGNNTSLAERNLSAALGAGVTPDTVDHGAIRRVADWLGDLQPPPSPHKVAPDAAERGRALYMAGCASCHGYRDATGYVFKGATLGKVVPNAELGVDPGRLDSYTAAFRERQLSELFAGTPYRFARFAKTDGYANLPLDGLWLRGPYLHNGAVPTLRDLLSPQADRPAAFVRGLDVVDGRNGGFVAPRCDAKTPPPRGFCFDTTRPGNGNGGHRYGTDLAPGQKDDLLAYLLTF